MKKNIVKVMNIKIRFSATTTIYDSEISEFKDWVDANYLGTNVENNIQTEKDFYMKDHQLDMIV